MQYLAIVALSTYAHIYLDVSEVGGDMATVTLRTKTTAVYIITGVAAIACRALFHFSNKSGSVAI